MKAEFILKAEALNPDSIDVTHLGKSERHTHGDQYRLEIDGLRGIAVLGVVFFHVFDNVVPGGFVGVDFFFVISGFLIATISRRQLEAGRFSRVDFLLRRFRRIVPAFVVLILAVLAAGWYVLLPDDYARTGVAAVSGTVGTANINAWKNTGYFSPRALTMPLLHLWSLSVEEQFYLFFPLIFPIWSRQSRSVRVVTFSTAFLVSFSLSAWAVMYYPWASFYLMPSRAWELLAGVGCAFVSFEFVSKRISRLLACMGAVLILLPMISYDMNTPFPGVGAVLPVVGACLVILGTQFCGGVVKLVLSSRLLTAVGAVSYSLYLWHWPFIVFVSYSLPEVNTAMRLGVVVVSGIASFLSWNYVEQPVRVSRHFWTNRRMLLAWSAMALLGIASGGLISSLRGIPSRLPDTAAKWLVPPSHTHVSDIRTTILDHIPGGHVLEQLPRIGAPEKCVFVWGDSHAAALLPVFSYLAEENKTRLLFAHRNGSLPILGVYRATSPRSDHLIQPEWAKAVVLSMQQNKVSDVVLVGRWSVSLYGQEDGRNDTIIASVDARSFVHKPIDVLRLQLNQTLKALEKISPRIWLVEEVPGFQFDVRRRLATDAWWGREADRVFRTAESWQLRSEEPLKVFNGLANDHPSLHLLDPKHVLLDPFGRFPGIRGATLLYSDQDHLSPAGAMFLRDLLRVVFKSRDDGIGERVSP